MKLSDINWPRIRMMADYSDTAYRFATVSDVHTDAQAMVSLMDDGVVVAFRGSSSAKDFIQDAKFRLCSCTDYDSSILVHAGFYEDWKALSTNLETQVRGSLRTFEKVSPNPGLHITGHSLGGAMAVLCAFDFAKAGLPVRSVTTFGQPRAGNSRWRDVYNIWPIVNRGIDCGVKPFLALGEITTHVINANDPVPLFPPLLFGYRDEGNELFLKRGSGFAINPSIGTEFASDLLGAFKSWRELKLAMLPNHLLKNYVARIQGA